MKDAPQKNNFYRSTLKDILLYIPRVLCTFQIGFLLRWTGSTHSRDDKQISFFLLLETLVAAHLGLPATGPANTGLASSCAAADSGAHPGVHARGIRGNCAARLSGIILRAQDRAGDSDDPRESAHNPAEDEPRGHSRRDIDVPFQFL